MYYYYYNIYIYINIYKYNIYDVHYILFYVYVLSYFYILLFYIVFRMTALHPSEFSFFPKSWIIPEDESKYETHKQKLRSKGKKKVYIVKPSSKPGERGSVVSF